MRDVYTTLSGFSGEQDSPLGEISLLITVVEAPHHRSEQITFLIIRSDSPNNMLFERTTIAGLGMIPSTMHSTVLYQSEVNKARNKDTLVVIILESHYHKDLSALHFGVFVMYVVPTGRVVVPTGRYVVPAGKVIIIVSPGRLNLVPTGRILSHEVGLVWPFDYAYSQWALLVPATYLLLCYGACYAVMVAYLYAATLCWFAFRVCLLVLALPAPVLVCLLCAFVLCVVAFASSCLICAFS
ncbi:hypothetical protein Tco_1464818 [Tanacetum coccineum]